MDTPSTELAAKLQEHVQRLENDPNAAIDERLFDECLVFLAPKLILSQTDNIALVIQLSTLSPKLQQDPDPVIRLLEKLVDPFTFKDILSLQPPVDFEGGLSNAAQPYNRLMLRLIEKAAHTSAELSILANLPFVVKALVNLWLTTSDTGIAEKSAAVLLKLLAADCEAVTVPVHGIGDASRSDGGGQGLLWRRLFGDKDIYSLLFSICVSHPHRKDRSLAQARLMSLAPKLGNLDWSYLIRSHHPDIERQYGLKSSQEGLLDFLAVHMVDYKSDVLLHMNLIQFYEDLITHVKQASPQKHSSVSLDYLQQTELHQRTTSYWLLPNDPSHDPADLSFLYGPSAQYVAAYAYNYPEAFLNDANKTSVLHRLSRAFSISASQWGQGQSPKHDLHVLVSLPRIALLPQMQMGIGQQASPAFLVPTKNTNPDALNSLARIFHGPLEDKEAINRSPQGTTESIGLGSNQQVRSESQNQAAAARVFYTLYFAYHEMLFVDLVDHANIIALPDKALAAINVISSIASASWAPLPSENAFSETESPESLSSLPSESKLNSLRPSHSFTGPTALTGIEALLQSPARECVFPYLLRPPQTFTHLVGGRGDPESNAYKVAMAKWDCLLLVEKKLSKTIGNGLDGDEARLLLSAIHQRVQEGPWGTQSNVGGQVASLEL